MKTISWKKAFDIATNYQKQDKITLIVFVDQECDVCGAFIRNLYGIRYK